MPTPLLSLRLISFTIVCLALSLQVARSQDSPEAEKKRESSILLRVICKQPVTGATDLQIVQDDKAIHHIEITNSLMTEPLVVDRGELLLSRLSLETESEPVLKVTIPKNGKRFVLALFSSPNPTPEKPYEYRLVRTDGLRFGTSDLYLFNLTKQPIGGFLGKQKFNLKPDGRQVVTPVPEKSGSRMYQSRFYHWTGEKQRIFNDTRWPRSNSARIYIFFIPDPERQSIGYLSFREYEPFP